MKKYSTITGLIFATAFYLGVSQAASPFVVMQKQIDELGARISQLEALPASPVAADVNGDIVGHIVDAKSTGDFNVLSNKGYMVRIGNNKLSVTRIPPAYFEYPDCEGAIIQYPAEKGLVFVAEVLDKFGNVVVPENTLYIPISGLPTRTVTYQSNTAGGHPCTNSDPTVMTVNGVPLANDPAVTGFEDNYQAPIRMQ
jgi:hypothetical protein